MPDFIRFPTTYHGVYTSEEYTSDTTPPTSLPVAVIVFIALRPALPMFAAFFRFSVGDPIHLTQFLYFLGLLVFRFQTWCEIVAPLFLDSLDVIPVWCRFRDRYRGANG